MTDLLSINIITTLLKQNNPTQTLLNELLVLLPTNYIVGSKTLSSITEELPSGSTLEEVFDIYSEKIDNYNIGCNTIILFSEKPFSLRINSTNEILTNIYHFSYSGDNIEIHVCNTSLEEDLTINYIMGNSQILGSDYVYT